MLSKRLVLFDWLVTQLGASSFEELRSAVNRPELEGVNPDRTTRFVAEIEHMLFDRATSATSAAVDRLIDNREILREMEANIVRHWSQIAAKRTRMGQEIFPTYFQWLSLLGVDHGVDRISITRGGRNRVISITEEHDRSCRSYPQ